MNRLPELEKLYENSIQRYMAGYGTFRTKPYDSTNKIAPPPLKRKKYVLTNGKVHVSDMDGGNLKQLTPEQFKELYNYVPECPDNSCGSCILKN